NTGTDSGRLWKVMYTGSGAPFISIPPASVLVSAGEPATFRVTVLGETPLSYTWYVNEEIVPGVDGPELAFGATTVDQDSSRILVMVSNAAGETLSEEAILRVTPNQRPEIVITRP